MAGKPDEVAARRKARLTMLSNQLRLAQENLDIEVAEACAEGFTLRTLGAWLEVSHTTVANMREAGIEAGRRRGGLAAEQRG
jgi:hypothetical protein